MTIPTIFYDYPEYDFIDFLYLNGYFTSRPTADLPDALDRTIFENRIRRIAAQLNCHRRKPKELIDPFYTTNFRWVFSMEDTAPDSIITSVALLRAPDVFSSAYDIIYFETEEGMGDETLQTLWKHALWSSGVAEHDTEPPNLQEIQKSFNATLLEKLNA